jgi:hypothetical protein
MIGIADPDFAAELAATTTAAADLDLVFVGVNSVADLSQFAAIEPTLGPGGAIWIIYPKGRSEIRERDVRTAGRDIGCKDIKVVAFSATHTALKFVVPRGLTRS